MIVVHGLVAALGNGVVPGGSRNLPADGLALRLVRVRQRSRHTRQVAVVVTVRHVVVVHLLVRL